MSPLYSNLDAINKHLNRKRRLGLNYYWLRRRIDRGFLYELYAEDACSSGYTLMNFPPRPFSSNLTIPSTRAKRVSSLPRPTFFPGFHFVPRCRARILPPRTCSPPNFFRPNRCELESRPLRDEPTPFLCAIVRF